MDRKKYLKQVYGKQIPLSQGFECYDMLGKVLSTQIYRNADFQVIEIVINCETGKPEYGQKMTNLKELASYVFKTKNDKFSEFASYIKDSTVRIIRKDANQKETAVGQ